MQRILKYLMVLIFLPAANKCFSQILSIDKSDTADYDIKAKSNFNFSIGLEIDKQKTTLYDATNTAEFMLQKKHELFIASGSYRFTSDGPDDILNAGFVHFRLRHNYKDKLEPEVFTQYQWDNKRGLLRRLLAGANIRYNFWKGDVLELNAAAGLMFENEKWNYAGVDSSKIPAAASDIINSLLKINSYLRLDWKPNANSDITFKVYFQTRPDRLRPRIAPLFNWTISAGKHTAFSVGFNGIYDSSPVVPIDKFYYNLTNSLVLKW